MKLLSVRLGIDSKWRIGIGSTSTIFPVWATHGGNDSRAHDKITSHRKELKTAKKIKKKQQQQNSKSDEMHDYDDPCVVMSWVHGLNMKWFFWRGFALLFLFFIQFYWWVLFEVDDLCLYTVYCNNGNCKHVTKSCNSCECTEKCNVWERMRERESKVKPKCNVCSK